jgi:hypothetical protein
LVGLALIVGSTKAAIISVTGSQAFIGPRISSGNLSRTISGWNLNGGNAVAVMFGAENGDDLSATFAGESMTVVEVHDGDRHYAAIAYLIDPVASTGDIVINATRPASRISHAFSIVSLSNVGAVAGSQTRTNNGGLGYTTTLDGGYVLGSAENNSYNYGSPITVSGNPDVKMVDQAVDGNCTILQVHGDVGTAGSYTDNYSGSVEAAATVAFDPIPEPSTLCLATLGLLGLIGFGRRRKR